MNEKMTLLFVKETGHVLAAITRAADAESEIEAGALAGTALLVRYVGNPTGDGYGDKMLSVPADQLDVFTADYEARALLRPNDYFVSGADDQKKSQQVDRSLPVTVSLSMNNSQVTVEANVPDKTKALIILSGPTADERQVVAGEMIFNSGTSKATINIAELKPGTDYLLLALIAGVWPYTKKVSTP